MHSPFFIPPFLPSSFTCLKTVLLIGHDANRAGAQLVLLQLMRLLKQEGIHMRLLLGAGGALLDEYQQICPVVLWPEPEAHVMGGVADKLLGKLGLWQQMYQQKLEQHQHMLRTELALDSVDLVLVNTVTSGRWLSHLPIPPTVPVVTFVHELLLSVRIYTQPDELSYLLNRTSHLLAVSRATARYYEQEHGFDPARITLFTLIDTPALIRNVREAQQQPGILESLGIGDNAVVVGGCGNAEWRKGNDLFLSMARMVTGRMAARDVHFVWVGMQPGTLRDDLLLDIQKADLEDRVHLIPQTPEVLRYMCRFDVFVLCSREDPYPLVVLEAGLCNLPVVCFDKAGGSPELVEADGGFVVPYLDLDAMSSRVVELIEQPDLRHSLGRRLSQKIQERHPARQSVETLLTLFAQLTNPSHA